MLEQAIKLRERLSDRRTRFVASFALFDTDRMHEAAGVGGKAGLERMAAEAGITIIWQRADHECFLLRHFEVFSDDAPIDNAEGRLQRYIPGYNKNMPAEHLRPHLPLSVIQDFARREPALAQFLSALGLPLGA